MIRAGLEGHVDVEVEDSEVREEHVEEYLREVLVVAERGAVLVMKLTWSWRAQR
jgi:hypothetical protein